MGFTKIRIEFECFLYRIYTPIFLSSREISVYFEKKRKWNLKDRSTGEYEL